jgi:putative membrane-bound dehydrogenase-like protein
LSPKDALRTIEARPGFTVELVVAEPLVESPIAIDWGPDGKLWVVEMGDYPLGLDNKGKPGGRIRYLEDTDGDGHYKKSTIFLDKLLFPTGVLAWRKGVLVTCAPDIFYAEDTDGDGRADKREALFSGFGEVNPQHRVNGLRWGLDNWIYCANGDFTPVRDRGHVSPDGGRPATGATTSREDDLRRLFLSGANIKSLKTGAVLDIRNRDFRFRPDDGLLDPQTGQSQFGRDRDDWGNWFGCNNDTPMWHFVLDDRYIRRNPYVAAPNPRVKAPPALTYPTGSIGRDTGSKRAAQGNAFTSGCSITVYRDDLFGPEFANNWLVCEPVYNLVHREVLVPAGASFSSRRAADEARSEFLASSDPWFSPVMVRTGPDGALWVVDMYRKVLEHPHWLPPGWEKTVDVRAGYDRGRVYRVYPKGQRPRPIHRLDRLDTAGLVNALDSPNGWQRDMAQRLLVQGGDKSAVALLGRLASESTRPECRVHALCTLDGLSDLRPAMLKRALGDRHPGVRRQAVRLCETRFSPALGDFLEKLITDPDASVRLQLACSLGEWDDPRAGRMLADLMIREVGDPYLSAAAMSSVTRKNLAAVADAVLEKSRMEPPSALLMENLLRSAQGFGNTRVLIALLERVASPVAGRFSSWQYAALAGWLDALEQRDSSLAKLGKEGGADLQRALKQLAKIFDAARALLADPHAGRAEQVLALRLLGRGLDQQQEDVARLAVFLTPQTPDDLQAAVVAGLGELRDPRVAQTLLQGWKGYGPKLRSQVLEVLFRREEWVLQMLAALERKHILSAEIGVAQRQRLLEHRSAAVQKRAAKLFAGQVNADRQMVVEEYKSALVLKGDAKRGLQVFTKTCATCHRVGSVGHAVGPDLAMVRDKPPEWFLPAILDPNQAVEAKYVSYMAVTKSGAMLTGVLSNESGNSITLLGPENKPQVILRENLEELVSTGKSLMPEGLEKELKPQDVADLIAFLRSDRNSHHP